MSKRKHIGHTLQLKAEVLRRVDSEPGHKLCKLYDLAPSTLSTWKKNRSAIMAEVNQSMEPDRKRIRHSKYNDIEKAMLYWLKDMSSRPVPPPLDMKAMLRQAERFAENFGYTDWKGSRGFLYRFCHRYSVLSKRICGEGGDCPDTSAFVAEVLFPLLAKFEPDNIYNCDETALFYKLLPSRTYTFKGQSVVGGKSSKDRVTLMLCSNMSGTDKLKPLIIGKTKKPQVLKRVYNMSVADLPVDYYSSQNGWMTGFIFDSWLSKWNSRLARQGRNILLLLDNAPSHVVDTYSNITIQFLPPNTTAKIQPMDQGILRLVKLAYRARITDMYLDSIINNEEAKSIIRKMDIKVACDFVVQAWNSIREVTIQKCFSKAGFLTSVDQPTEDPHPYSDVWQGIQQAMNIDTTFEDFATADDGIESSEHLTEAEIVQAVLNDCKEHEEDPEGNNGDDIEELQDSLNNEENKIQTSQDFLVMISHQRAFLQRHKLPTDNIDALEQTVLNHKLRKTCQSSITAFFTQ